MEKEIKFGKQRLKFEVRDDSDDSVIGEVFKWRDYRCADEAIKSAEGAIIDAGAHIGTFAVYCKIINSKADIVCLEPEPGNFSILKRNLRLNRLRGVRAKMLALAAHSGPAFLEISRDSINHRLTRQPNEATIKIEAVSFGDLRKRLKIGPIAVLKMDVEGAEYEIMAGLNPKDLNSVAHILLEYHDDKKGHKHEKIAEFLRKNKFGVRIFPSNFDKNMGYIWANNKNIDNKTKIR